MALLLSQVARNTSFFILKSPNLTINATFIKRMSSSDGSDVKMLNVAGSRQIAYRIHEGKNTKPTVIFVPGFMSTMEGFKAQALEKFCKEEDRRYVRFDFEGIGKSPGNLSEVMAGHWIEDLRNVVKILVPDKALLVGSSMGGWFSIKVASELPDKIHSLLLVAPAINFFKFYYNFFYKTLPDKDKATLDSGNVLMLNREFGQIFLRKSLMEESISHHIDVSKPIPVQAPVRIIHGVKDPSVPYKQSLQLMSAMTSFDVDVIFRKNGEHQMSEEIDLQLLIHTLRLLLSNSHL